MRDESYAILAYDTYCKAVGGVAYNGDLLPTWEKLPEKIKDAWWEAAARVRQEVFSQIDSEKEN